MIYGARNFKLINGNGAEYDLSKVGSMLVNPSGLGYSENANIERVGYGFISTDITVENPTPNGEILFRSYEGYNEFLNFVQVGGLTLGYMPLNEWRYLDCIIQLEKTEIDHTNNFLICPVTFIGLSYWYEKIQSAKTENITTGGKIYGTSTYPYTYTSGSSGELTIENGNRESYATITIFGACTNPSYYLYKGTERIHSGKVNVTIQSGEMLVIKSNPSNAEISLYSVDGTFIRNVYGLSDFTTERLFSIPRGTHKMVFSQDGTGEVVAKVEVLKSV